MDSITDFVRTGNTELALELFSKIDPTNGALLQAQFNCGKNQHLLDLINAQEWRQLQNKINHALLNSDLIKDESSKSNLDKAFDEYLRGIEFLQKEDWANALSAFSLAIGLDENYAKAYCNKGYVLMKMKKYDMAVYFLEKAIQLDPNLWAAYHNLGLLFIIELNENKRGCECLKKAKNMGYFDSKKAYRQLCNS